MHYLYISPTAIMFFAIPMILCVCTSSAYNILSVLPIPFKSHFIVSSALLSALADEGHNLTVYTLFPQQKQLPNFQEIDISQCFAKSSRIYSIDELTRTSAHEFWNAVLETAPTAEEFQNCYPLMDLLQSTTHFDALITEPFNTDVVAIFSSTLNIPLINILSLELLPYLSERMGSPSNPSYIPSITAGTIEMDFFDRLRNTYDYILYTKSFWRNMDRADEISRKLLGSTSPSLMEVVRNTSLIFTNSHFSYNPVKPLAPGIIEIGGIQIQNASDLPKNIEKFINESTNGVVYFSMGSLLQGTSFPEKKRNAFLYAFSKIPQRILWKWESDDLPAKLDNIMILKWMPQRDILAHPNVRLFISHGGFLGTTEAVYEGVPILGIPIFGDQRNNIKSIEEKGAGEVLEYRDISGEVILEKIQRLINQPKYKENMKEMSARFRDRPMSPKETVVYWTEYVIRHKGAHHLKTAAVRLPWYQYFLLDVIAFAILVFVTTFLILYHSIRITVRFIWNSVAEQTISSESITKVKTS